MKSKKLFTSFLVSVVTMMLCLVSFAGTTFAWFTDTVSNTGNKIQAGTLDVELYSNVITTDDEGHTITDTITIGDTVYYNISNVNKPVFDYNLWEPGYSTPVGFAVVNKGDLALKYKLQFSIQSTKTGLQQLDADYSDKTSQEYLDKKAHLEKCNANSYLENAIDVYAAKTKAECTPGNRKGTLKEYIETNNNIEGTLLAKTSEETVYPNSVSNIVLLMPDDKGNEYENASISFDIVLLATQLNSEVDGFNNPNYDKKATYPIVNLGTFPTVTGTLEEDLSISNVGKIKSATVDKTTVNDVFEELKTIPNPEDEFESVTNNMNVTINLTETGESEKIMENVKRTTIDLDISLAAVMTSTVTNSSGTTTTTKEKTIDLMSDYQYLTWNVGANKENLIARHNKNEMVKKDTLEALQAATLSEDNGQGFFYYNEGTGDLTIKFNHTSPFDYSYDEKLATGVTINPISADVYPGQELQLTTTVTPEDAQDKTVTWSSDNDNVATVDQNGKVTVRSDATPNATATITATTSNGKTATCELTVADGTLYIVEQGKFFDNLQEAMLAVGENQTLKFLKDYTLTSQTTNGLGAKKCVIDLNGKTLTASGTWKLSNTAYEYMTYEDYLELGWGTPSKEEYEADPYPLGMSENPVDLTIKNGTYVVNGTDSGRIRFENGSTGRFDNVTIKSSSETITYQGLQTVSWKNDGKIDENIYHFTNCSFKNVYLGFEGKSGSCNKYDVSFKDCDFDSTTSSNGYNQIYIDDYNYGKLTIDGCDFSLIGNAGGGAANCFNIDTYLSYVSGNIVNVDVKDSTFNVSKNANPYTQRFMTYNSNYMDNSSINIVNSTFTKDGKTVEPVIKETSPTNKTLMWTTNAEAFTKAHNEYKNFSITGTTGYNSSNYYLVEANGYYFVAGQGTSFMNGNPTITYDDQGKVTKVTINTYYIYKTFGQDDLSINIKDGKDDTNVHIYSMSS